MKEVKEVLSKENFRGTSGIQPKDLKVSKMGGGYFK